MCHSSVDIKTQKRYLSSQMIFLHHPGFLTTSQRWASNFESHILGCLFYSCSGWSNCRSSIQHLHLLLQIMPSGTCILMICSRYSLSKEMMATTHRQRQQILCVCRWKSIFVCARCHCEQYTSDEHSAEYFVCPGPLPKNPLWQVCCGGEV